MLSALEFERHAGAATKNQNDHIFLDCGISIYGLVKKVHNLPLDSVCGVLERMIGHPPNAECYEAWRGEVYHFISSVVMCSIFEDLLLSHLLCVFLLLIRSSSNKPPNTKFWPKKEGKQSESFKFPSWVWLSSKVCSSLSIFLLIGRTFLLNII